MAKWKCDCGCGAVVIEAKEVPTCCGKKMKRVPDNKEAKCCCTC